MKGIICSEIRKMTGTDSISWEYCGGGDGVPVRCQVFLGDIDPMTGEAITDITWFVEYRKAVSREVESNLRYAHVRTGTLEKAREKAREEKEEIRRAFRAEHGYEPDPGTVHYLYLERHPERRLLSVDYITGDNREGDGIAAGAFIAVPEDTESEAVARMQEYVWGLNPRQRDIYRAMLLKYQGGGIWIRDAELAEKWGVSVTFIRLERVKIMEGIRKAVAGGTD